MPRIRSFARYDCLKVPHRCAGNPWRELRDERLGQGNGRRSQANRATVAGRRSLLLGAVASGKGSRESDRREAPARVIREPALQVAVGGPLACLLRREDVEELRARSPVPETLIVL